MTALLTDNLPLLAGAPNGIKKLRELILELAVRGKLVEQDASDEPASELLKRIATEKTRLVEEAKINKPKPLAEIVDEELLFDLPRNWSWVRLGDLLNRLSNGYTGSQSKVPTNHFLTRIETISQAEINYERVGFCMDISNEDIHKYSLVTGDILLSHINSDLHLGKTALYKGEQPLIHGTNLLLLRPSSQVSPRFIDLFLTMRRMSGFFLSIAQHAIGQASVNQSKVSAIIIALPPLTEQHRIVAKVDELMALCDRLEAQQADAESAHAQLVQALLGSLTQACDATEFAANWQRLAEHFHTLFSTEPSIDALKQTLLQLAVMGKLVPQDPADEPASALLGRLAVDANKYAKEQKIAPPKPDPISASLLPSLAPPGWEWTRLCSIFRVITDGDHQAPPKAESGVAFLTIGNITKGRLEFSGCRFVPQSYFDSVANYRKPALGDILYTVVGATYGRPVFVDSAQEFCVQRHVAILKCCEQLDVRFACYLLASPEIYDQATSSTTGTAQPTIPLRPLRNFLLRLPPLAEQQRIVAKVDQLMALCDQLKTQLSQARQLNQQLASTLVEQAVA